jgi:hypothetical protein
MLVALAIGGSLLIGFLAGLAVFKRSLLWCKTCGSTLTCTVCTSLARQRMQAQS